MHKHRLDRLARLTKGAALVSIGAVSLACNDTAKMVNNAPEPVHINSPAPPMALDAAPPTSASATADTTGADASAAPAASASATLRAVPHTMNAMPRPRPSAPDPLGGRN